MKKSSTKLLKKIAKMEGETPMYQAKESLKNKKASSELKKEARIVYEAKKIKPEKKKNNGRPPKQY